jgi:glycosyltransferase involved in cell wall biosynthesis
VLTDGEEGWLVPPENPRALAGAICAYAADPARVTRLGEAARRRAERLDAVEVAARLDSLYASLL